VSNYISIAGEQRLKDELRYLWREERPRVTQQVSDAAALGDRSENAEYIYGKKRLREIDRRVRYLSKRLEQLTVVREKPADQSKVYFGARVSLATDSGETVCYRLLGPDEIDVAAGDISIDSPMGKTLLGKSLDSEVRIKSPTGTRTYVIVAIDYTTP
jgi:transcription elongation factor GreB